MEDEATLLINADGTYEDGNPAALAILGVTREGLRALPAQALSMESDRAVAEDAQASWEERLRPAHRPGYDATP